jgi:glycosyltransferase involved in cell wall biosynthesis
MLVPSIAKQGIDAAVQNDAHPVMDYYALQQSLDADLLDYSALEVETHPALVRLARRAGRDAALAALAFSRRHDYDLIYSNGENVSIPLALLLKGQRRRPAHVLIGHRVSPRKKRPFLRALAPQIDAMFLYCRPQWEIAKRELKFPEAKLHLIPFHADHRFYRPIPAVASARPMICSAGLEWRDYPTLIEAVAGMDIDVKLAAASPWSKHRNETTNRELPANVSARRYDYAELRQLYAAARFIVVPLYENDFQAGITTILEGMAMGKAIVTSRTTGQIDTIQDGSNGLYVPPGDPQALRSAVQRLLDNPIETQNMGIQARMDMEAGLTLDHWVNRISCVIRNITTQRGHVVS